MACSARLRRCRAAAHRSAGIPVRAAAVRKADTAASQPGDLTNQTIEAMRRSEEHTSELQSRQYLVCRLLLETNTQPLLTAPHLSSPRASLITILRLRFMSPSLPRPHRTHPSAIPTVHSSSIINK